VRAGITARPRPNGPKHSRPSSFASRHGGRRSHHERRGDRADAAHRTAGCAGTGSHLASYLASVAMDNFGYEVFAICTIGVLLGFLLTAVLLPW